MGVSWTKQQMQIISNELKGQLLLVIRKYPIHAELIHLFLMILRLVEQDFWDHIAIERFHIVMCFNVVLLLLKNA